MEIFNKQDFNTLKIKDKTIREIRILAFFTQVPEINLDFEDGTKVFYLDTDRNESVFNSILRFCILNKFPKEIIKDMSISLEDGNLYRSKLICIDVQDKGKLYEDLDLNDLIFENILRNKIWNVASLIGFLYTSSPEFHGFIVLASYKEGGTTFLPSLMTIGYQYSKVEFLNPKAYEYYLKKFNEEPFFRYISNLYTSALNEVDRDIIIFKQWIVLEAVSEYFINKYIKKKIHIHKKEKVMLLLHSIEYKGNTRLTDRINKERIDYIYEIRNDVVHGGFVKHSTFSKYKHLSKNSLQDQCDFLGYVIKVVVSRLLGSKIYYKDNFLDEFYTT